MNPANAKFTVPKSNAPVKSRPGGLGRHDALDDLAFLEQGEFIGPVDPAELAAGASLRRILQENPGMVAQAGAGIALVIEVPDDTWVQPVAAAWCARFSFPGLPYCSGDETLALRQGGPKWILFLGDDKRRKGEDNSLVADTLINGGAVLGVAVTPERDLPSDLLRVADARIRVPRLNSSTLTELVAALTEERLSEPPSDELAGRCTLADLRLARRPGEGATPYLARLRQLTYFEAVAPEVTLNQLQGMDEARDWGEALARDLADYRAGKLPWSAVDKGVLVYGPPGTGKTTFAKALAGTCKLPLISGSLAQWQANGHLGDLLKAMRATFEAARCGAPAILFIDEIDSFGDRASQRSDNRDYGVQVINGFLELLDGIEARDGVVVVGACNQPQRIDPAIVRSGRLDRQILIPLPDKTALRAIFQFHLGEHNPELDLDRVATLGLGGTGADVARWIRGAMRRARVDRRAMVTDDVEAEIRGPSRQGRPNNIRRSAVHEAGHALILALHHPDILVQATIRQTDTTAGAVMLDVGKLSLETKAELDLLLRHLLAGRAAEELLLGSVSAGAGGDVNSDLARATSLALNGLSALGLDEEQQLLWLGMPKPDQMGRFLAANPPIAQRIRDILNDAYARVRTEIETHADAVERIAALLLEKETADQSEILTAARLADTPLSKPCNRSSPWLISPHASLLSP